MQEPTFNEWWLSLSEGQQKAWMQDKWRLADISFRNGIEIGKSISAPWISVKERLPEEDDPVLIYSKNHMTEATFFDGDWRVQETDWIIGHTVTHWMPLPPTPEANK